MGIKNFLPKQANFYKYTLEIVVYMVIIDRNCSDLDIWLKVLDQDTNTEDIILISWSKKAIKQQKINFK